nr:ApiD [Apiospora montagnei]
MVHRDERIAIIGSACRFPGGASSPSKLWDLLEKPRDVLKEFDPERLNLNRFHSDDAEAHGSTNVINKSYILEEDTRRFDASFFGISPMEAAGMDPQQRQLLETVYESFDAAGLTLEQLRGSLTSVHVGTMTNDWTVIQLRDPETIPQYTATGTANSIISNRISYVFDLKGPSVTIDTACSSSLVALHQAARGLLDGDAETAVVGGANIILDPCLYITESKLHMLSPDARSRMWDKSAKGYARGEGTAAVILKTLSKALADGDHIEGIIRSSGVNSDGQSPGITMPFAPTQTALIQQTYRRAGLDPVKDRPQYFEAHGTGTQAGDPVEARAISDAFVTAHGPTTKENPLYVGSIKTVVGHLEGCAGLAGVMKVLAAIKHRVIPPNLLFEELNPSVAPYYGPLSIPTTARPWPQLPPGTPARASVNSFGFGGTNAHAIIESFEEERELPSSSFLSLTSREKTVAGQKLTAGPLLFSAASGSSLLRSVQAHLTHLKEHPEIDLGDLSWTLQTRRSAHGVRAFFSAASRNDALKSMEDWVQSHEKTSSSNIGYQPRLINPKEAPGILGIFTGQGAQWPEMGRRLLEQSPLFRSTIEACEKVLQSLPTADVPSWSLVQELTADASSSRLHQAALAQPLSTAVQLGLIDLLHASGVRFDAVVGHSSGEIAAVYAAGIISRAGAMQISYYRGVHAGLARGPDGQRGAMMAAGLPLDKAMLFCGRPQFEGRLKVAASNAPQGVTLSGDADAIEEAKQQLDADGVFARLLKVDTAYHSHHMLPCAEPYLQSLRSCDIEVRPPRSGTCVWSSSVRGDTELLRGDLEELKGPYWVANMAQTVLFTQAIESSLWHGGPFDLAMEVGPHPALKGPSEQTFKAVYGSAPLYTGVLKRGTHDVEAFGAGIGTMWMQLGPSAIDFAGLRKGFQSAKEVPAPKVVQNLPAYSWDHEQIHWRESALSRRYRTGKDTGHELLGRRAPDDTQREMRWRNILRLSELPWLRGHEVLGEVLLPGAAYVSLAVEAAGQLGKTLNRHVRLIQVENVDIMRPVVVPNNRDGVETLFTVRLQDASPNRGEDDTMRGDFSYYVCVDAVAGTMMNACSGEFAVQFGESSSDAPALPLRDTARAHLVDVGCDRIYSMFDGVGLKYTGPFHALTKSSRSLDYAIASGTWSSSLLGDKFAVHPAQLDVAFQTLLVAQSHPASGQTTTALLPSHIDRVVVDPSATPRPSESANDEEEVQADFESWAVGHSANSLTGDVNVYTASGKTLVQVEGLTLNMVGEPNASLDRPVFAKTIWTRDIAVGGLPEMERDAVEDDELLELTEDLERVALFYAQRLAKEVATDDQSKFQPHHRKLLAANAEHLKLAATGRHPMLRKEWLSDGPELLPKMDAAHPDAVQLKMLHAVGGNYTQIVRGELAQLQVMTKDDLLNRFFMDDLGCIRVNRFLADALREVTIKYPRCDILEIGAGTGGTTWSVLNAIDDAYASYTFTDVSPAFLPAAQQKFADFVDKMVFKTLDVENDPALQGYVPHSYDIVVAANVLHATRNLERTMKHVRSMLRPGGYLLLFETTGVQNMSIPFIFGGLPSWWPGEEPERKFGAIVRTLRWDEILQNTGFSGLDMVKHDVADESKHTTALLVTQAVDDTVLRLREPLAEIGSAPAPAEELLLVGGKNLATTKMLSEMQKLLPRSWRNRMRSIKSVDDVDDLLDINPGTDIICLHDLDEPLFASTMTGPRLAALQKLLMNANNLLWVTSATNSQKHAPRATMFHGIARIAPVEMPHLHLQVLGLESNLGPAVRARHAIEAFLRLKEAASSEISSEGTEEKALMWAQEPEVEVFANGDVMIPRVVPDKDLNQTYIASKRTVTNTTDATDLPVRAVYGSNRITLQVSDGAVDKTGIDEKSTSNVQVDYSLHLPSQEGEGLYLVCGKCTGSSSPVLALSSTNASIITVPSDHLIPLNYDSCTPELLVAAANQLFAQTISSMATSGRAVLLYGAEPSLAAELSPLLSQQGSRVYFATSDEQAPDEWIKLHAQSSKRSIQRVLPGDVALFVQCSTMQPRLTDSICDSLPGDCEFRRLNADLLKQTGSNEVPAISTWFKDGLFKSAIDTQMLSIPDTVKAVSLAGTQVSTLTAKRYITNWEERESLPLTAAPLNTDKLFQSDRTYLMVGAAGGLGFSICKWVLAHGAKHMVITSRNPRVDDAELEPFRRAGASIEVVAMDVTDRASVERVVETVRTTMPPIAGVCNAAMVLSDKLFLDMSLEQLNGTLGPKVDGSEILDSVFASDELDFFIMLSSSATVLGNNGQANYHIANLYMESLAAQRRARGQAGSIIHVGHITDVGYVVSSKDRTAFLEEYFRTIRLIPCSETDVHHAFAQAIRGGQSDSNGISPDIIMGIEPSTKPLDADVADAVKSKIPWLLNPRLGHLVPFAMVNNGLSGQGAVAKTGSVMQRAQDAETEEEAAEVVLEAFSQKLEMTLGLPEGRVLETAQRPIIDLGIDSLVAVEIRTWFLKELGTEVPVVKLLGGDSAALICNNAAKTVLSKISKKDGQTTTKSESPIQNGGDASATVPPASQGHQKSLSDVPSSNITSTNGSISGAEDDTVTSASQDGNSTETGLSITRPGSTASSINGQQASDANKEKKTWNDDTTTKTSSAPPPQQPTETVRQERMSRAQARIWFLSKHLEDPTAYNMVFHYRVTGDLNLARLRHALHVVAQHHECLRMCFYHAAGDGYAMQGLMPKSAFEFRHVPGADEQQFELCMADMKTRHWDIEAGKTFAVTCLSRGAGEHDLVFGYHHIISDVVGLGVMLQDLDRAYRMQPLGQVASHIEYTARETERETGSAYDTKLAFWCDEFSTLPDTLPMLPMATLRARPTKSSSRVSDKRIHSDYRTLTSEQASAVKAVCAKLRVSPFHFYLAILQVLLTRLAGVEDVCIGVVDANRGEEELSQRLVGCLVNVLPVRGQVAPRDSFAEVARAASRKALGAFSHAGVPIDLLLEAVNAPRSADGVTPPLFQAAINYRAAGWGEQPLGPDCSVKLTLDDGKDAEPPYDISLGIMDMGNAYHLDLHCQSALYSSDATSAITDIYLRLIDVFTADPEISVERPSLHDDAQVQQALSLGKGPKVDFGWPGTLSQRVRDMVHLYPAEPAVSDGSVTLTYSKLAACVDNAAKALRDAGCITGDRIAVLCEPSTDSVVAMLAILQAGCVYVPLDVSLPVARHAAMVQTYEPSMLIYHEATKTRVQELKEESQSLLQELRMENFSTEEQGAKLPEIKPLDPKAPAILLFTSGSTGTPKGIVLTQANFVNHLALKKQELNLERENVLQQSSLGFDMSVIQTFCALANGGHLFIAPSDKRRDPVALTDLLCSQKVSLTIATPSEYLAWLRYGDNAALKGHTAWRNACMGGEPISSQLRTELRKLDLQDLRLTNCYGPTEITAAATFQAIDLESGDVDDSSEEQTLRTKHAVGKALPNYTVQIIDATGRTQPLNNTGEICIGGEGLALGYLNLPEETQKRFIADPITGERLYRTGDQGRLLSDGTLLCFGRLDGDTQVKIRGLRVELQEIEVALLHAADGLLNAVIVSKRDGDVLIAHATATPGQEKDIDEVKLSQILSCLRLPQYFVPTSIIVLDALPTNANGKLDRRAIAALPLPEAQQGSSAQAVPMNVREGELRLLWEKVLPQSALAGRRLTPSSDFFLNGGNSLVLMRLQAAIRESMGIKVSTRALYRDSTLSTMAKTVFEAREADALANADEVQDIDWAAETAVPEWLKKEVQETISAPEDSNTEKKDDTKPLEVVLTGSTAFLGGRILAKLLESPTVGTVHCIAVPADDEHLLPANNDKIRCYTGSLADTSLGLSAAEQTQLQQTADAIVHAGASGHCLNNYPTLRAPNLGSTHRLASLALPRSLPLLFVSSNRVALLGGRTEQRAESLAAFLPPLDGSEGYTASKWAGEVFLENLAAYYEAQTQNMNVKKGWSPAIHRPCIPVGDQAPNSDSMNAILRYSLDMKCVPRLRRSRGYIDFTSVDDIAAGIVDAILLPNKSDGSEGGGVRFQHHSSNVRVPMDGFAEHLGKVYGGEFDELPMREWMGLASKAGIDPLITAYLDGVVDTDEEMTFPYLGE